jgi:hypothetical protein
MERFVTLLTKSLLQHQAKCQLVDIRYCFGCIKNLNFVMISAP